MASLSEVVEPNPRLAALWPRIDRFTVTAIARAAGVSRGSILDIRSGKTTNPGIMTIESVESALTELEQAETKKQSSEKTDGKQTKSRKSSELATAAAGKAGAQ